MRGKLFFTHGSNHSCGVMILVRTDLDFNPRTISCNVMMGAAPL